MKKDASQIPAQQPLVELREVSKNYGAVQALQPTNLTINQGEFLTLLGPSGCGKSTLLRLLGGFEIPTGGTIAVAGKDVTRLPPERRPFNMVFQSYALFPHLTVSGNLAYGPNIAGFPQAEIAKRTDEVLEMIHLPHLRDRKINELSGGQQQRIALARALINRPKVLLLDEPLSALDLKLRKHLQAELRRIQRQLQTTFVFVTHDQEEAMSMSHRICLMDHGWIRQIGKPDELYNMPNSEYSARFIGEANFFSGIVDQLSGGKAKIRLDVGDSLVLTAADPDLVVGASATAMLRPEHLEIMAAGEGMLDGTIRDVIFFGPYQEVCLTLDNGVDVDIRARREAAVGEEGSRASVAVLEDRGIVLANES